MKATILYGPRDNRFDAVAIPAIELPTDAVIRLLAKAVLAEWPNLPIIVANGYVELPKEAGEALPRLAKPSLKKTLPKPSRRLAFLPDLHPGERTVASRST